MSKQIDENLYAELDKIIAEIEGKEYEDVPRIPKSDLILAGVAIILCAAATAIVYIAFT